MGARFLTVNSLRGPGNGNTLVLAQAAKIKCHRLGGLNNRNLFLTVLKAGSPTSGCQHDQVVVRGLLLVYR